MHLRLEDEQHEESLRGKFWPSTILLRLPTLLSYRFAISSQPPASISALRTKRRSSAAIRLVLLAFESWGGFIYGRSHMKTIDRVQEG